MGISDLAEDRKPDIRLSLLPKIESRFKETPILHRRIKWRTVGPIGFPVVIVELESHPDAPEVPGEWCQVAFNRMKRLLQPRSGIYDVSLKGSLGPQDLELVGYALDPTHLSDFMCLYVLGCGESFPL